MFPLTSISYLSNLCLSVCVYDLIISRVSIIYYVMYVRSLEYTPNTVVHWCSLFLWTLFLPFFFILEDVKWWIPCYNKRDWVWHVRSIVGPIQPLKCSLSDLLYHHFSFWKLNSLIKRTPNKYSISWFSTSYSLQYNS